MYIRQTTQKNKKNGEAYATHRLVESYRNANGQVRQQTLLNLGAQFNFPKDQWKLLADRIETIRQGQQPFFEIDIALEIEAQRIAKLIIIKTGETDANKKIKINEKQLDLLEKNNNETDYQSV